MGSATPEGDETPEATATGAASGPDAAPDGASPGEVTVGRALGAVLVLVSSAVVLVAEIVAARAIAPYVGITLETIAAVIGVVLAGIALGHWLGGRLADRHPADLVITGSLAVGGVLLVASPWIVSRLGPDATASDPTSALVLATAGFFLPSVALSMVSPCVVKSLGEGSTRLGSVAGSLSALGTLGALVGNFGAGFVLVGTFGVSQILRVCGLVSLVLAVVAEVVLSRHRTRRLPVIGGVALLVGGAVAVVAGGRIPCDVETEYVCLNIDGDPQAGYLIQSNIYSSSFTNPANPTELRFSYARDLVAVTDAQMTADAPAIAYVGGGGYTLPLYYEATRPGASHVVYEIDGQMVDAVAERLELPDLEERFPTAVGDARVRITEAPPDTYDLVIGDAFAGVSVPWHLTTVEFLRDVRRTLAPGGLYVMNLIDYDGHDLARAEVASFQQVFPHVAVVARPDVLAGGDAGANILLIGSDEPIDAAGIAAGLGRAGTSSRLADGAALDAFVGDAEPLTDELAPVDQLVGRP